MPTREEIAGWLREAAFTERSLAIGAKTGAIPAHFYEECMYNTNKFEQRAAQVEAMRCETCARYDDEYLLCSVVGDSEGLVPPDFGCFAHEPKTAD